MIMSCYQHRYSRSSLATPPYRPLLSADPQGYIPNQHIATVCRFKLDVLSLLVHVRGPHKHISYELVPTSPAVSRGSLSPNFHSFRDGW